MRVSDKLKNRGEIIKKISRKFTLRVNDDEKFKNRIVSKFSINEAIDYIEESYKQGIDEFLVLENTESEMYVQCVFQDNGFLIQTPREISRNLFKLVEINNVSVNVAKSMFFGFMNGEDIVSEYSFKETSDALTFEINVKQLITHRTKNAV